MSMLQTLFGGVVAVLALHWMLGRAGMPNYWRGVISAAIPTFAYAAYSTVDWPGLDVVAIHVAVFLAAATVMTLLAGSKRKAGSRIHWIPKVMMGFFAILFVVDAAFVTTSTNGLPPQLASLFLPKAKDHPVYTGFSGVTEHNEQAAAAVNQHLKKLSLEQELGWDVEVVGLKTLKAGGLKNPLRMRLLDRQKHPMPDAQITVEIFRAGNVDTLPPVQLIPVSAGEYAGAISVPEAGLWVARIVIEAAGKRVEKEREVNVAAS